jgi:DNA-binding transcriptional ArsR family regulator
LRDAGLVHSLEEGRHRRHYRDGAPIEVLRRWLADETEAGST